MVTAEGPGVVAVFVAGRDHQQPKTDDLSQAMRDLIRRTRVHHAGGQAIRNTNTLLDLAQHQNATVRRQQTTVEFGHNRLAGHG